MNIKKLLPNLHLPIIDVRSESEYAQGHIPNAINLPILNDNERKQVGICYKQEGSEHAIQLGYALVGHKFSDKIREASNVLNRNKAILYCWRGGLRSKIFSEVLVEAGFEVERIINGYQSFRKWALEEIETSFPIIVLGGSTGTGKTELLIELKNRGEQIINLEGLANHKGSAYGGIGMSCQPSNEQFENELALIIHNRNKNQVCWIENESRHLGKVKIPDFLHTQMRNANVLEIEMPIQFRIQRILKEYSNLPKDRLIQATRNLEKRLGNLNMNKAIEYINEEAFEKWIELLLNYYDKLYAYGSTLRNSKDIHTLKLSQNNTIKNADLILNYYDKYINKTNRSTINTI